MITEVHSTAVNFNFNQLLEPDLKLFTKKMISLEINISDGKEKHQIVTASRIETESLIL